MSGNTNEKYHIEIYVVRFKGSRVFTQKVLEEAPTYPPWRRLTGGGVVLSGAWRVATVFIILV